MTKEETGIQLLRVGQAATRLGLSTSHTYRLIESGRMRCVRLGRAVRVSEHHLAEYVRQCEKSGEAEGPRRR